MAKRFNVKNIVSWGLNIKGLTREQCDSLMLQAVNMGGAVVVRPECMKVAKNERAK